MDGSLNLAGPVVAGSEEPFNLLDFMGPVFFASWWSLFLKAVHAVSTDDPAKGSQEQEEGQ